MESDVLYAMTDDAVRLPVIDVTNPAFAVSATDEEIAAMCDQFMLESRQRPEMSAPVREALQRSRLGRGIVAASGTFLTGMDTYLLKLGPDNLGADANPLDLRIAASFPALMARVRLQDMAGLVAGGLSLITAAPPPRPLCLVNIGGGPAADSWNALLRLQAEHPDILPGRATAIAVLDCDGEGPAFGARALDALRAPGAPLDGLDVRFRHIAYEWSRADRLRDTLDDLRAGDAACAISSEGALFEYASDIDTVANLRALHAATARDAFVVGSVTRDGGAVSSLRTSDRIATRPRTLHAFRNLAEEAGWIVQHVIERPFTFNVRLVKA